MQYVACVCVRVELEERTERNGWQQPKNAGSYEITIAF